ncbi:MAG: membrane protein insertion efficiency factor YidD [Planctomycetales bacterium]|nr:membrane protein insertion efficiency factor YidD [Planctomycetales bacterium]
MTPKRARQVNHAWQAFWRLPANFLIVSVRFYQAAISPWIGAHCRFTPTCSQYFIESVRKYGAIRGAVRGVLRICRCHPFHRGGYDPP